MTKLSIPGIALAVLIALLMPAPTGAFYTHDKLAFLTFNAPVQVPGAMLQAGTYRFRLTNPDTSRSVLQVLSNDGKTVFAHFLTRPDSRTLLSDEPTVTFLETPAGVPPAIRSLFYGGEYRGYEFVWGKGEPNMIAEVVAQPPITYTAIPAAPAPVIEPAPAAIAAAPEVTVEQGVAPAPAELPRTATPLPLLMLGGLASLLGGLGLRRK